MDSDGTLGMIFLSQTVLGVLGNLSLLYYYLFLYFSQSSLRPTDCVLMHLIAANVLTLLCKGVPQTMAGFGWKDFLNDCECKGVFYLHKVGRSMSFSSISFLSVFQAITISPNDSKWAPLKCKAPKYVVACVNLSWILNLFINTVYLINISSKQGNKSMTMLKDFGYCSSVNIGEMDAVLHMVYLSFPDAIYMWLMLWASGSIVLILHRHKRSMQHMFRSKVSPQFSPHTRATQTILLLMSTFICFYLLSSVCQVCLAIIYNPSWFLVNMSLFIAGCFPTVSPFLLLCRNYQVKTFCFTCVRNRKAPWSSMGHTQCLLVFRDQYCPQSSSLTLCTVINSLWVQWMANLYDYIPASIFISAFLLGCVWLQFCYYSCSRNKIELWNEIVYLGICYFQWSKVNILFCVLFILYSSWHVFNYLYITH